MFALLAGYQYRSAAVVSDDPAPANPDAVSVVDELRGQPGTRVPHAWVCCDGRRISTLDLVGPGFTLFTGAAGAPWGSAARAVSSAMGVSIDVHSIGPDADVDGQWARLTDLAPDAALLVRPDDFVAWRASALPQSPESHLGRVLCQVLGRTAVRDY